MKTKKILLLILPIILLGCGGCEDPKPKPEDPKPEVVKPANTAPIINYSIVKVLKHDSLAFTEGLLFYNGDLYESTGSPDNLPQTKSFFGKVDMATGKIDVKAEIDRNLFGEGICFLNDKVFQLTYKSQKGFIYDAKTFKPAGQFTFANKEGWGFTTNGKELIMSDGTNMLTFLNPDNFSIVKTIDVNENNVAVDFVNELEYVDGFIYANIYTTNTIVKIDAETGKVVGKFDIGYLLEEAQKRYPYALETNGIAYNPATKTFLVTGKMWPCYFEIKLS